MHVIGESPAELGRDFYRLPDRDNQSNYADEDVDDVPDLPVGLEVALRCQEDVAEGHPGDEHHEAVHLVDGDATTLEQVAPSLSCLPVRQKEEALWLGPQLSHLYHWPATKTCLLPDDLIVKSHLLVELDGEVVDVAGV